MKGHSPPVTASLGFGIGRKTPGRSGKREVSPKVQRRSARILVVDSDPALRRMMVVRLGAANYRVESADSARAALDACERFRPNVVITALRMAPMDGLGLLGEVKSRWPDTSVIILTAHGTIPEAVRATQRGAFGFLVKPIEKAELLGQVQRAVAASAFTQGTPNWRADIVSRSQLMEDRIGQANCASRSDVPVLLSGESGTGKELFARAIHAASRRRDKPFKVVNCDNTDEKGLEAELFGSGNDVRESEPGPVHGAFQAARGGTLLLSEIGALPIRLQVRLVTALREDEEAAGTVGTAARSGVRLICSTSSDLKVMLAARQFHEDLYYRISVLLIEVPSLGRRREDIPLLVTRFLVQATEEGGVGKIYSPQALQMLVTADWPGNVRQLFELVKKNVALSPDTVMTEEFVEKSLGDAAARPPSLDDARDQFARDYLLQTLQDTRGNVSKSARLAKRNRTDFYKLLLRYRLEPDEYKQTRLSAADKKKAAFADCAK
jgi:two-component system, NtrC family, response regulator GlrR